MLGVTIYNAHTGLSNSSAEPIFAPLSPADETTAPPRTQSTLLKPNEQRVTIDGRNRRCQIQRVIATQSPAGTMALPLPGSQPTGSSCGCAPGYPGPRRREILRNSERWARVEAVLAADSIVEMQGRVQQVTVDSSLVDYMLASWRGAGA